jgi:hypothetical protein
LRPSTERIPEASLEYLIGVEVEVLKAASSQVPPQKKVSVPHLLGKPAASFNPSVATKKKEENESRFESFS